MADLRSPDLKVLMKTGRYRRLPKKQVIQTSTDQRTINLVSSGYIKRYLITNGGEIRVQAIFGPGDFFPLTLVFKAILGQSIYHGPETYYYETMCETRIYNLSVEHLIEELKTNPAIYNDLLCESGNRLSSNIQRLENASLPNFYKRLAHQLFWLANKFGEPKGSKVVIKVPLTQQDVADVLSASRETVAIALTRMSKSGLIDLKRNIVINNMAKLEQEAYG